MSVELDPLELGFKRPFQQEVSQTLHLKNPHSDPVAFKVKTTAPKQYCVRPNSGRIEPGKDVEVQILLQAMKEDPPPDAKCRDKFLVQSVLVTTDREFANVGSLWSHIEQSSKSSIQEKKIRVLFLPADDVASTPAKTNGLDRDPLPSSPPETFTPQRGLPDVVASTPLQVNRSAEDRNLGASQGEANYPAIAGVQSTITAAATSVNNAIPSSQAELQAQLNAAKAQIARLSEQASESAGLRQRKTDSIPNPKASGTMAFDTPQTSAGGVPMHVTAGLCLLCFLLAYFLF